MPEPTIREATASDLPAVLALHGQPAMDDGRILPIEDAAAIHARMRRYPHYRLYVASHAARIVGAYTLLIMDKLGHMGAPSAIVEDVLVDPACQGRGIGTSMMRHARREAAAQRCYKLVLSSSAKRTDAHAFYESLGFTRYGYSFGIELADTGEVSDVTAAASERR